MRSTYGSLIRALAAFSLVGHACEGAVTPAPVNPPAALDFGWHLWLDDKAAWQNDTLYLPEDVKLDALPVNPPTGGWQVFDSQPGISVSLPGTVEEHYWGQAPSHVIPANDPGAIVNRDGAYFGVSWWYRSFTPPALKPGEHLLFSFPGARMRAEVYANGKLCGYDLITETAFDADATAALRPGQPNQIAVRITNPGGNFSWGDYTLMRWGKYDLPPSHGFGGLNGGVTMAVRGPVAVTDLAVLNTPDPKTVTFTAEVTSTGAAYDGPLALTVAKAGKALWSGEVEARVAAGGKATVSKTVTIPGAQIWDIGKPVLYTATAAIPAIDHSGRDTTFGFRWFTAKGVGTDAKLYLNDRRVVVKSAISWGFWSPNGIFPDQAAADREVAAVNSLGLNAIQNHRHMPKPIVLDTFDRAGLMRYCEAGAGCFTYVNDPGVIVPKSATIDTSGTGGEPTTFYNRYELAKVLGMIKAERSHPSAIIWSLQNEASIDRNNPKIYWVLHKMREADPSRIVMLESGFSTHDQAWALPYSDSLMIDTGSGSGWNDRHTAEQSVGVYLDKDYKSATDFKYNDPVVKEISTWGELATGASPDDHAAMAAWYKKAGVSGYDRAAREAITAGYEKFLDDYQFRSAFPTAEALFRAAADKHYYSAAKMFENARINDANDYIALSGWESTVVDNHSGLVDALRLTKTDPAPIKAAAAPALLVVRARHHVIALGDPATVDVHLVNEYVLKGSYILSVTAQGTGGKAFSTTTPVTVAGGETFAQVLRDNVTFTPATAGPVKVSATLSNPESNKPSLFGSETLLVVATKPAPLKGSIAYLGAPGFGDALNRQFGVTATALADAKGRIDVLVLDPAVGARNTWQAASANDIHAPADADLYKHQMTGPAGPIASFAGIANGPATADLLFAETKWKAPGQRVFDVALNGQTVLKDFDIVKEAGGGGIPLTKSFPVTVINGTVTLAAPAAASDMPEIAAIRITDTKGRVTRKAFRTSSFRDAADNEWRPVLLAGFDWTALPEDVLRRVRDDGTRLVVLSNDPDCQDASEAAAALAERKVLTFAGMEGNSVTSWLGFWYFGKTHWLLDGLPANCALDWQYQITNGNGLLISAPGLEAPIGYGINHSPRLGLGAAVIPCGKGQIVLFCLPGLDAAITGNSSDGINAITAKRMIYNCLASPPSVK